MNSPDVRREAVPPSLSQSAIRAGEEDERVFDGCDLQDVDLSYNDPVIAGGMLGDDLAFDGREGVCKQRHTAGSEFPVEAGESVRSGGKLVVVSWFGAPLELDVDALRERSLRFLFPDISTLAHLEHTVQLVASGRVRLKPTITHVLHGLESVPQAFEITANKAKYQAINPAQVVPCR